MVSPSEFVGTMVEGSFGEEAALDVWAGRFRGRSGCREIGFDADGLAGGSSSSPGVSDITVRPDPATEMSLFGLQREPLPHLPPPQQPSDERVESFFGQVEQGLVEQTESPSARQKAFPKSSSLHAIQFDGSPEHTAAVEATADRVADNKVERRAVWVGGGE